MCRILSLSRLDSGSVWVCAEAKRQMKVPRHCTATADSDCTSDSSHYVRACFDAEPACTAAASSDSVSDGLAALAAAFNKKPEDAKAERVPKEKQWTQHHSDPDVQVLDESPSEPSTLTRCLDCTRWYIVLWKLAFWSVRALHE